MTDHIPQRKMQLSNGGPEDGVPWLACSKECLVPLLGGICAVSFNYSNFLRLL